MLEGKNISLRHLTKFIKILDKVAPGASRSLGWEVLITALSFPASILLNRALGAEDRGLLASIILIPSTIFAIGSCQWNRLLVGLITSKQISGKEAWRRTIYYTFLLSILFIPLGIFSSFIYVKLPLEARIVSAIYCAKFPIHFLCECLAATYNATGSIDGRYAMRMSLSLSYLFLLFTFVLSDSLSVSSAVFIYFIIHVVSLVFGLIKKNKLLYGNTTQARPPLTVIKKGFIPFSLETFSSKLDVWAFSLFGTLITLGYYTGITAMMLPVGLVSQALTVSSTARLDWKQPTLVRRYMFKTLIVFVIVLAGLAVGGILLGSDLLNLFLGKSFKDGEWMIPWIAVIVVSNAAATQFHSALQLSGFQSSYLLIQTMEPLIRLAIVLGFGWWFSEIGILCGIAIASTLKAGICFWVHQKAEWHMK
ncbi:hypothetical protein ABN584_16130 [Gloeocapsa sp. BRSZ]